MILVRILLCLLILRSMSGSVSIAAEDPYLGARMDMVRVLADRYDFRHPDILSVMREVPRHLFVPREYRSQAYADHPVPIGEGQTISQPYIVAFMTEILRLKTTDKILEVGTGSGYQAAVASKLVSTVYTVEIFGSLAERAAHTLSSLGFRNVITRQGDGYYGWEEKGPFDAIIVTCAGTHLPPPLLRQLKKGGRMVMPVGGPFLAQNLVFVEKDADGSLKHRNVLPVSFVRLLGH